MEENYQENNARGSHSIDLFLKNMPYPCFIIREPLLHGLTPVQPLDNLRDVQAGLHVEVRERIVRVVKTAGVVFFQLIHHHLDNPFRREYLVCFLGRPFFPPYGVE